VRERAQTLMGSIPVGLAAALALVALMLVVERDSLPILPGLLPAVWLPLFAGVRRDQQKNRALMLVLVAEPALFALGLVVVLALS
jgi:hypothetical protein